MLSWEGDLSIQYYLLDQILGEYLAVKDDNLLYDAITYHLKLDWNRNLGLCLFDMPIIHIFDPLINNPIHKVTIYQ